MLLVVYHCGAVRKLDDVQGGGGVGPVRAVYFGVHDEVYQKRTEA